MRDGFIFYESFRDAMRDLPAKMQLKLYNAIADYALYDQQPDFDGDGIARGFFALIRPQIDANIRKRENGAQGGRPAKETKVYQSENQTITKPKPGENQTITKPKPGENQTITKPEPKEKEKAKANANAHANANVKENAKAFCADKPRRAREPTMESVCARSG